MGKSNTSNIARECETIVGTFSIQLNDQYFHYDSLLILIIFWFSCLLWFIFKWVQFSSVDRSGFMVIQLIQLASLVSGVWQRHYSRRLLGMIFMSHLYSPQILKLLVLLKVWNLISFLLYLWAAWFIQQIMCSYIPTSISWQVQCFWGHTDIDKLQLSTVKHVVWKCTCAFFTCWDVSWVSCWRLVHASRNVYSTCWVLILSSYLNWYP